MLKRDQALYHQRVRRVSLGEQSVDCLGLGLRNELIDLGLQCLQLSIDGRNLGS